MTRRLALLAVPLAAGVIACAPPPQVNGHQQLPVPACTETVTVIDEGDPLPCIPGPGQRLDVLVVVNGDLHTAQAKCLGMGGTPQGPASDQTDKLLCRMVTV